MNPQQVIQVDPQSILRPKQVRTEFPAEPDEEMIASIRAVGILHPLLLRREDMKLIVIDGERRLRAAIALAMKLVPSIVTDDPLDSAAVIQRQLIANCVREGLSTMDQSRAIQQLMNESGCTAAQVAARIGKSAGMVSKLLAILEAPIEVQAKVASGELGVKAAYELARHPVTEVTAATMPTVSTVPAVVTPASKPVRLTKLTALLDRARSVTVHGVDSTIDAFITVLDELLSRTRAAKKQGVELPTYLAILRDQART